MTKEVGSLPGRYLWCVYIQERHMGNLRTGFQVRTWGEVLARTESQGFWPNCDVVDGWKTTSISRSFCVRRDVTFRNTVAPKA